MLESIDEAVAVAKSAKEFATPESALRRLLLLAWNDLQGARSRAINGCWSVRCDDCIHRIVVLTRIVGPVSWDEIDVDLVLDGVYERVHESIGTPTPLADDDRRRARDVKAGRAVL